MGASTSIKKQVGGVGAWLPRQIREELTQKALLYRMTERQRYVLLRCLRDGCSMAEVARELGVNPSTISRTVSRALRHVREQLGEAE